MCVCLSCTAGQQSLPRSRPQSPAEMSMGYREAVDEATQCAVRDGYADPKLQSVEELKPNFWCVRFGVPQREGSKSIEFYFDGTKHKILKADEAIEVSIVPSGRDGG
jgi:hypothetical protein